MKKKVLMVLVLFAFIGASVAFAQFQTYKKEVYRCTYCSDTKSVNRSVSNRNKDSWTQTTRAPSNTGLCKNNPSKLSTAHNFQFEGASN